MNATNGVTGQVKRIEFSIGNGNKILKQLTRAIFNELPRSYALSPDHVKILRIGEKDLTAYDPKSLAIETILRETLQQSQASEFNATYVVLRSYRDVLRLFGANGHVSHELLSMISANSVTELRAA